ncbi:SusC/RagA family TonB-linked outer membrane protein [Spongiivirga citrea]|uniref:SusC/RagA family TonB-linked outer membrane protein n=1 Tax=Spongiivirga citrea TaxID=1481457 RepID=A0A6M0CTZ6_9FLAO|nr:SusC/RagA family TonB-linked outer membrane protein [Spongiivirga citrea]NER18977.1 SusC/RagA family TonB-linked outer membrane protein [Spongiivirga citrea]
MKHVLFKKAVLAVFAFLPIWVFAQQTITGKVTDASSGEPLFGVTVLVKGTTTGALTDFDGNFSVEASADATLVFSYIGYSTIEVLASDASTVQMKADVTNLDEVVVTGLATSIKRSNLANNISTISSESLTGTTTGSTLDGALYGKLTGVNINSAGGAPGGQTAMRLRGISSLSGNNQPLFIVDGVYISNVQLTNGSSVASGANAGREEGGSNRVSDINPEDIESIEVLKGASAAAIYGTRANAGVVIITTKRGKAGKTVVKFDQDVGFNTIQNYAGRRQFTSTTVASTFGAAEVPIFEAARDAGRIFNYEEELYGETGLITESRFSISGGNEKTKFYFNASKRDEDGIMKRTGYGRNSLRLNLDHRFNDKLKVGFSSNYVNSTAERGPVGNENNGGFSVGYNLALVTADWEDLFPDENGVYPDGRFAATNIILNRDLIDNEEEINRYIQGANFEYKAITNENFRLKFTANGGLDYFQAKTFVYIPEFQQTQRANQNGFVSAGNTNSLQLNYNAFAVLDFTTNNKISINGQFGISYLNFESDAIINQTTELFPQQTNLAQGNSFAVFQRLTEEEEFGIIAQSTANWDDKIIATAGVRFDKSNLNGDPNKFFAFPRASLAINVANFDFWNVEDVNLLKLRVAYGETGSSARFGSLFTPLGPTSIGGVPGLGLPTVGQNNQSAQLGDANLEPEISQEIEYGIDFSFLNGKIGLELTGYKRDVKNLIYPFSSIPLSSGFANEIRNDFDLSNTGFEIALNANPISNSNINWNTTLNWWKNEAEVESLGVGEFQPSGEGFSLTFGSSFIREGETATSLAANIGGVPTIIGDAAPDFEMSWFNQISLFKDFDLTFLWHWKKGGDVLNLTKLLSDFGGVTPDLDDPDVIANPRFGTFGAAGYIEDGTYVRLREVGLFYTLPTELDWFERVRVGVSGKNLITITDYSSYDPETSAFGPSGLSQGIEVSPFPSAKQVYFHIGFTF